MGGLFSGNETLRRRKSFVFFLTASILPEGAGGDEEVFCLRHQYSAAK